MQYQLITGYADSYAQLLTSQGFTRDERGNWWATEGATESLISLAGKHGVQLGWERGHDVIEHGGMLYDGTFRPPVLGPPYFKVKSRSLSMLQVITRNETVKFVEELENPTDRYITRHLLNLPIQKVSDAWADGLQRLREQRERDVTQAVERFARAVNLTPPYVRELCQNVLRQFEPKATRRRGSEDRWRDGMCRLKLQRMVSLYGEAMQRLCDVMSQRS